jgi:hypothetical protein
VNLLSDNIANIKKNTENLTDASRVVGLEINIEEIKYMLLSHHQNAGQNLDVNTANMSSREMVATIHSSTFKHLLCCS